MKIGPVHYAFEGAGGHARTGGRTNADGGFTKSYADLPYHKTEIQTV